MLLSEILVRLPVNRMAAIVTSQRRVSADDAALTTQELKEILWMLERKKRLLNRVVGIKNRSQKCNANWKFKKGIKQYRQANEPRAFAEYRLVGMQMQQVIRELAEHKNCRRFAAKIEQETREHSTSTNEGDS